MTITEFLNARLDEQEADGRSLDYLQTGEFLLADVAGKRAIIHQHGSNDGAHECPDGFMDSAETEPHTGWEVVCMTQRHLASIYSEHPDYREEWKP